MKSRDQRIFLEALDELEKEKGIVKEELLEAVEVALMAAYKKNYGEKDNAEVTINRQTGEVKVFSKRLVVEKVENPDEEISFEDALGVRKRIKIGDTLNLEISAESFKRNAIQNAKQIVVQKVRECEKKNIYNKFKQIEKTIVSAVVRKTDEKGNLYIDINGLEAIIPEKELSEVDKFVQGDRIKLYIGTVEEATKYTKCYLSRKADELMRGLLELEIPEIEEGTIEIKQIAREAGSRTKVAVYSEDKNLDVKGACIGKNGMRIQSIIDELRGEKIDIVLWDEDMKVFVKNALNPAEVLSVDIVEGEEGEDKEKEKVARVVVAEDQLSLAIGKKGQNSRLAAKLCGIKIDIHTANVNEEESERTCVCWRKKREKKDFFRISEFEGKYVFDKKMNVQSRGFYVCKDIKCLERLSKHKKYNIDIQYLLQMLEELKKNKKNIIDVLKPMKNSDFFVFGIDENIEAIKSKKVKLIVLPKDIKQKYIDEFIKLGKEFNVDILFVEKKKAFLEIFSRDLNVVGIFNKKVINGILSKVEVTTGESTWVS